MQQRILPQKTFYKLNKKANAFKKRCLISFPNTFNGLIRCMINNVCREKAQEKKSTEEKECYIVWKFIVRKEIQAFGVPHLLIWKTYPSCFNNLWIMVIVTILSKSWNIMISERAKINSI